MNWISFISLASIHKWMKSIWGLLHESSWMWNWSISRTLCKLNGCYESCTTSNVTRIHAFWVVEGISNISMYVRNIMIIICYKYTNTSQCRLMYETILSHIYNVCNGICKLHCLEIIKFDVWLLSWSFNLVRSTRVITSTYRNMGHID